MCSTKRTTAVSAETTAAQSLESPGRNQSRLFGHATRTGQAARIQQVMERIVTQTIPEVVVNNPPVDWNPWTNEVKAAAKKTAIAPPPGRNYECRQTFTRYAMLLENLSGREQNRSVFADRSQV